MEGDSRVAEDRLSVIVATVMLAASFWSTAAVETGAGLLALLFVFSLFRRRKRMTVHAAASAAPLFFLLWGVYVAGVLLSIALSPSPLHSAAYLNKLWHSLLFPIVGTLQCTDGEVDRAGRWIVLSGAVAAFAAIVLFHSSGESRLESPLLGTTTFTGLLAAAGVIALGIALESGWHWFLAVLAITAAIFSSTERAPTIALLLGGTALVLLRKRPALMLWGAALAAVAVITPVSLWYKLSWVAAGHPTDRYILWKAGLGLLRDLPFFGYGPESFDRILPASASAAFWNRPPTTWHNDVLQSFLESGWVTGCAYVALSAVMSVAAVRGVLRKDALRGALVGSSFCILVVLSLVSSEIGTAVLGTAYWTSMGFVYSLLYRKDHHGVTPTH